MSKELAQLKKRMKKANAVALTALNESNDLRDAMQAKFMEYQQLAYEARVLEEELRKAIDNLI